MLTSEKILALDIGTSTVKVAEFQASRTHGLKLTNFNYAELGIDPDHEENRKPLIISTIRNALREKGLKTRHVVFSVSGQSVFTRFVKLPPVDQSKITQIIQYEAQQNVPFPIDEVIWDYQLIGTTEQGEIEVVLLAIKSDIIEDLNDSVESAGLRTELVDVAPMALYNAVRYNCPIEECMMVVDIGARTTNLLFLENNRVFSRSIPLAGNAITRSIADEFSVTFLEAESLKRAKGFVALGGAYEEPEDLQQAHISKIVRNVMTRLHADIVRSINFYRSQQGGSTPARILLSGGSSILPYTNRFFQEKFQVPVEYFNPFRNIEIAPNIPREELSRCAHFFGEVIGLALRRMAACPIEVNLLPRSIRRRKEVERKRPYLAGVALCLVLIPLCWLAYTRKIVQIKDGQLQTTKRQVDELRGRTKRVKETQDKLAREQAKADQIANQIVRRASWTEFMQDLNLRISSNLWIVALTPEAGTTTPLAPSTPVPVQGPRFLTPGLAGAAPASTPQYNAPTVITEIRIEGAGNHNDDDLKLVDEFAAKLRESPFFDKSGSDRGVEITAPPMLDKTKPVFTFTLRTRLAKPITY